jgi:hypothetical protein
MLKLDPETREIPILTYTTEYEGQDTDVESPDEADDDDGIVVPMPALRMN